MRHWIRKLAWWRKEDPAPVQDFVKTALTDMQSHDWTEYRRPPDDQQYPNWKMAKCGRCGYEYPLEQTAIYPKSCDEEIVAGIMRR